MKTNNSRSQPKVGRRHYFDGFDFFLKPSRKPELKKWLNRQNLKAGKDYVLMYRRMDLVENQTLWNTVKELDSSQEATISFKNKEMAVLFKLSWSECEPVHYPKVILPIIRNVMPTVIANQIIGISPMTGPSLPIHTMRAIYGGSTLSSPPTGTSSDPDE